MKRKIVLAVILAMAFTVAGCSRMSENTDIDVAAGQQTSSGGELTTADATVSGTVEAIVANPDKTEAETTKADVTESEKTITQATEQVKISNIDFASIDVCFTEAEPAEPISLSMVSEQKNNVSEVHDWFTENDLFLPMLSAEWAKYIESHENAPTLNADVNLTNNVFYDDNYIYDWTSDSLNIYDRNTKQLLYTINYQMDKWYLMGNCAYLRDGILYIGSIYNGYAMPETCFLLAYDLTNDEVLWRSEDQTYNSMNFIVKDNIILCGYGFTNEKDYLYQIDINTGKVIDKTELKKMPDLLVEKDGQLYVHTYSYDYVFDMN